jgi:hypothetical protein
VGKCGGQQNQKSKGKNQKSKIRVPTTTRHAFQSFWLHPAKCLRRRRALRQPAQLCDFGAAARGADQKAKSKLKNRILHYQKSRNACRLVVGTLYF